MFQHYLPPVVIEMPTLLCELNYGLLAHVCSNMTYIVILVIDGQVKMAQADNANKTAYQSYIYT